MLPAHTPEQVNERFGAAFNARDLPGLLALYEADALIVPQPGAPAVAGLDAIGTNLGQLITLGGTIGFERIFCLTAGDLAMMSIAFRITGITGPDGAPTDLAGTTCELVRRQPDGSWKYVIDHPFAAPAHA